MIKEVCGSGVERKMWFVCFLRNEPEEVASASCRIAKTMIKLIKNEVKEIFQYRRGHFESSE